MNAPAEPTDSVRTHPPMATDSAPPGPTHSDPGTIDRPRRRWSGLAPLLFVLALALAYANIFQGVLVLDDIGSIEENPTIRQLWPLSVPLMPPSDQTVSGRPIANLSFAINYAISGLNTWSYHATNLLIHLLAGLTLWGILRRTFRLPGLVERLGQHPDALAFVITLLWLVHPIQPTSVTYIVQRVESLMALFLLLTIYCTLRLSLSGHRGWALLAVLSCGIGMGCKEVMAVAPLLAFLFAAAFLHHGDLAAAWRQRPTLWLLLASTWIIVFAWVLTSPRSLSVGFHFESVGALDYIWFQCSAVPHYLRIALWPYPLINDYGSGGVGIASVPTFPHPALGAAAIFVLIVGMFVAWFRGSRGLAFLLAWFFVILGPSSSFLPIVTEMAAEHRMYLPLVAPLTVTVLAIYRLIGRVAITPPSLPLLPVAGATALAAAIVFGTLTFHRNRSFASTHAFWGQIVADHPGNMRARLTYGLLRAKEGHTQEAVEHFRAILDFNPNHSEAHMNLGSVLALAGRAPEALPHMRAAAELRQNDAAAWVNLGNTLASLGQFPEAMQAYQKATQIEPENALAHFGAGVIFSAIGRDGPALMAYSRALRTRPNYPQALDAAAWLLATSADPSIRNGAQAVALARRAAELTGGNDAQVLDTLAAALAETGQFPQAIATAQRAAELVSRGGRTRPGLLERLSAYQSGKPGRP